MEDPSLEVLVSSINKELKIEGGAAIASSKGYLLGDISCYLSTGCYLLDRILGKGKIDAGIPLGRVIQVYGQESHGKSTFVYNFIKSAQRGEGIHIEWVRGKTDDGSLRIVPKVKAKKLKKGVAVLIDTEASFDRERGQNIGVDLENLIIVSIETIEDGFSYIESLITKIRGKKYFRDPCVPIVIVWDTIDGVPTQKEKDVGYYGGGIAEGPRKIKASLKKLTPLLAKYGVSLVFVNHAVANISAYGAQWDTSCGKAIKYWSALRLQISKKRAFDLGKENVGIYSLVKLAKSKICRPYQEVHVPIRYDTGIDDDYAILYNLVELKSPSVTAGKIYKIDYPKAKGGEVRFYYKDWYKVLKENKGLLDYCKEKLVEALNSE